MPPAHGARSGDGPLPPGLAKRAADGVGEVARGVVSNATNAAAQVRGAGAPVAAGASGPNGVGPLGLGPPGVGAGGAVANALGTNGVGANGPGANGVGPGGRVLATAASLPGASGTALSNPSQAGGLANVGRPAGDLSAPGTSLSKAATVAVPTEALRSDARAGSTASTGTTVAPISLAAPTIARSIGTEALAGNIAQLVAGARSSGQLPELVAQARTSAGTIATLAAHGGLTAREIAMLVAAGVLTRAEGQAARAAGAEATLGPRLDETARLIGYDRSGLVGLVARDKIDRPDPWSYMSDEAIALHLTKFEEGAVRVTTSDLIARFGSLGPSDGGFVVPYREFADLVAQADDEARPVEEALGLDAGAMATGEIVIARIDRADATGLRMPTGREGGANAGWLPGGHRSDGLSEAVMNFSRTTPATRLALAA